MNAKEIRKTILETAVNTGQAHLGGALSVVEILMVLYDKILNITPETVDSPDRDRLIYSKGHCPLAFYTILKEKKFFNGTDLSMYGKTRMPGHADNSTPGVEITCGSLGHGLPIAVGIALSAKLDNRSFKTYVVTGDTELNEGSNWESIMFAAAKKLNNLIVIVDNNGLGVQEATKNYTGEGRLVEKFRSFGWKAFEIDGHSELHIHTALLALNESVPVAIIANTIKGKGISFMENNPAWHHGIPKGEQLVQARKELDI